MTPTELVIAALDVDPDKKSGIYMIYCIKSNKCYIGQSKSIKNRFHKHKYMLKTNRHSNIHLQRAWNTYGSAFFSFYVLEICSKEELLEKEKYYYNLMDNKHYYNLYEPVEYTEDHAKKISESNKGRKLTSEQKEHLRKINTGRKPSPETVKKIIEANKGRKQSKETIEKRRNKLIGYKHSEESKIKFSEGQKKIWENDHERRKAVSSFHKGRKRSEETRKRISEANRNRVASEETKAKLRENIKKRMHPITGKLVSNEEIRIFKEQNPELMIYSSYE
jgi:group I intron endonuclease